VSSKEAMRTSQNARERALRRAQTDAERHLWQRLRGRALLGYKFRRQHRIGPYVVDFVCIDVALVIEIDGSGHVRKVDYDAARTEVLGVHGFSVLRFWNDDVLFRTDAVLEAILAALPAPHPNPLPAERGEGDEGPAR
jgi:lysyl-tRNA synthetase class 2